MHVFFVKITYMYALKIFLNYGIIVEKEMIFLPVSKAKLASNARYRDKQEFIQLRVGQGERDRYKALAARLGISVNQLFVQAVERYIEDNIGDLGGAADSSEKINK